MAMTPDPRSNRLLGLLPDETLRRWLPKLELVDLPSGKVLYESGEKPQHVYFPLDAIVSLLYMTEDGNSIELVVVGNEGLVGIALFMGGGSVRHRAVVRSAGRGFRVNAQTLVADFEHCHEVTSVLLRYTQALITQTAQTAVCNRHHTVDQQLCRWLLMSLDRLPGNEIQITQESIAHMLGVRREGITEAAFKMQKAGLISYYRGHIKVLDRAGLERRTCECYSVVKREYDRLIPATVSQAPEKTQLLINSPASVF
jgi:CRP-like cAMP-binding protein